MLQKNKKERNQLEFISIEALVPEDYLLRKIDEAVDFNKIYEFTEDLYCPDNGRPSIDPVVLFKMALIQYIWHTLASENSRGGACKYLLSLVYGLSAQ